MPPKQISTVAIATGLVLATFAAYSGVLSCGFVGYDDPEYVFQNNHVLTGLSWENWKYAWTTILKSNWHPITVLSLELDGAVWKSNPLGYHITNVVLHTLNVLLLFFLLNRTTGSIYRSGCVALYFALHPLHVESVAWISERKDVLSTFFLLLTILFYVRYVEHPSPGRYWPVVVGFAAGLLSKPMLVTLPILLLLLDWWPLDRILARRVSNSDRPNPTCSPRFLLLEKIPLLAIALIDGVVTMFAQQKVISSVDDFPLLYRVLYAFNSYLWYLRKTFAPVDLMAFYPHAERQIPIGLILVGAIVVVAISVYSVWHARSRPHLLVGWCWFVIALLPVIGLVQVGGQAYADRYAYIPHIGLFVFIAWECHWLFGHLKWRPAFAWIAIGMAASVCGLMTRAQVAHWASEQTLWRHAISIDPGNSQAHIQLALACRAQGNYTEALGHLTECVKSERGARMIDVHRFMAECLIELGRPDQAEREYQVALNLNPNSLKTLDELVKLLSRLGKREEALGYFERATALAPTATACNRLGKEYELLRRPEEAKAHFRRAIQLKPDFSAAHQSLGGILLMQGRWDEAIVHLTQATRLTPEDGSAWLNLGVAFLEHNDYPMARINLAQAVRLMPDRAPPVVLLASAEFELGDTAAARGHYLRSLELDPTWPERMNKAAWSLSTDPDGNMRNGRRAVQMARRVCQATESRRVEFLDTLAAAYAEEGHFEKAIETANEAIRIADAQRQSQIREGVGSRLKLYADGKAYRH